MLIETLDQHYKRAEEEGFDIDMTGANDDVPLLEKLDANPVDDKKWIEFFYNYFDWIHRNFNDCLKNSNNKYKIIDQLLKIPFHLGGFDLDFQTTYQQALDKNVELYNNYLHSFVICLEKQLCLSSRNKNALINMTKVICIMIEIILTFKDNKTISTSLLLPTEYQRTIYHSRINMNLPISICDEKKNLH
tara:strand:- start:4407 stop:4976 length:570 start_codon:yes stop_codon:yes gene_type:complete